MHEADDADEGASPRGRRVRWVLVAAVAVVAVVLLSLPLLRSVSRLERVGTDTDAARDRLADDRPGATTPESGAEAGEPSASASPSTGPSPSAGLLEDEFRAFLLLGSDAREGLAGSRADAILVGLVPGDGADPILFSLPRDLWLPDPCHGGSQRINAAVNGCAGLANGFELTSIVVEDFTGIAIDQVVGIDFAGFEEVIDAVGGVRICVENPVRDGPLQLPEGCSIADGEQALAWVRSRKTEELVDGQWQAMPGVNDLTRNQRQQQLLVQLLGRVGSFGTVGNLYSFAEGISDSVTVGTGLSALDSARLAWSLRSSADEVRRFSIPVDDLVTNGGAQVLVPTEPFATTFEREVGMDLETLVEGDATGSD